MSTYPMPHADAAWLRMDRPTNLMVINSLQWFDTAPDWDRVRSAFVERVVRPFPRFRQTPHPGALSGGHWEDDPHFDPAAHFHRRSVPAPHDRAALRELVGDLAAAPLDHGRPLWEVHLLEDYGEGAAMLIRIHHAVADGVALARVMLSAADEYRPPAYANGHGPHASRLSGLLGAARHPRRVAARGVEDAGALAKLLWPRGEASQALHGEPHVAHRVAWSDPVDLWRVRRTARAYRVKINDVLMAALAGALREHFLAGGVEPEPLHALVPFNLRPAYEPAGGDLGNHFGLVLAALPVHLAHPVDRLWEVNREMTAIKHSDEGALSYGLLELMGRAPADVEARLVDFISDKASLVVTNVPGPRHRLTMGGTPIAGTLAWAPCSGGLRMSVSLFSYAGKVTVGFLTDAGVVPEPQPLADAFRAQLLELARRSRSISLPESP